MPFIPTGNDVPMSGSTNRGPKLKSPPGMVGPLTLSLPMSPSQPQPCGHRTLN